MPHFVREASRKVTLQQGLDHWIMDHRAGFSTRAMIDKVRRALNMPQRWSPVAIVAPIIFTSPLFVRRWFSSALLYNPASFAMLRSVSPAAYLSPNPDLTLACATSRAHDECAHFCSWTGGATQRVSIPTELSFTRCRLTPSALILLAGSSVVKSAPVRLLGQGKGDGKYAR